MPSMVRPMSRSWKSWNSSQCLSVMRDRAISCVSSGVRRGAPSTFSTTLFTRMHGTAPGFQNTSEALTAAPSRMTAFQSINGLSS